MWLISFFLSLALANDVRGGGASSGVGNRITVMPGISSAMPVQRPLHIKQNRLLDSKTGETIMKLIPISTSEMKLRRNQGLVSALLGEVNALELVPSSRSKEGQRYWIICSKGKCLQLVPSQVDDSRALDFIGRLKTENK